MAVFVIFKDLTEAHIPAGMEPGPRGRPSHKNNKQEYGT
jgi:hypothetical protein